MDRQLDRLTQARHTPVDRALHRSLRRLELEPAVRLLLLRFACSMVFGLFVIMVLQNLGIGLLPLIAGLGVVRAC